MQNASQLTYKRILVTLIASHILIGLAMIAIGVLFQTCSELCVIWLSPPFMLLIETFGGQWGTIASFIGYHAVAGAGAYALRRWSPYQATTVLWLSVGLFLIAWGVWAWQFSWAYTTQDYCLDIGLAYDQKTNSCFTKATLEQRCIELGLPYNAEAIKCVASDGSLFTP